MTILAQASAAPAGPRVLVVDDDELVLGSVRDALQERFAVTATSSPRAALELLARDPHDVLLVDLMMQELRGTELIRAAKERDPALVALVMTGYGTKAVAIEALREGADDFLEKPLTPDVLVQAVEKGWRAVCRERENAALLAELHRANAELQRANEELQAMASFADLDPAPVLRVGRDGVILRGNPAAHALAAGASVVGRPLGEVLPGLASVEIGPCIDRGAIVVQETRIGERNYQFAIRGVPALALAHVYGSDVSELDRTRTQLYHSQRLEAIGKLAGGVAHDFNNLLTVVSLAAQHLQRAVQDEGQREDVAQIIAAASKGAVLTQQLLAFGRRELITPKALRVNDVVLELHPLLRRTVGEHIAIKLSLAERVDPVFIDRGQLEQLIVNLVVNARDAMASGGTLVIESGGAELDEEFVRRHVGAMVGAHTLLAVSDTGCGMPREVVERAFEPFFTTKPRGKGTGMGLATVYGVVKRAGGSVWIYSEEGRGTTVRVYLPVTDKAPSSEHPAVAGDAIPEGRGEAILLVEDDEAVRRVAVRLLSGAGYRVLAAADGDEALRIEAQHNGPIHLVLTDVIMPGLSGRELATALCARRPGVRVLFMSGYTDHAIAHQGVIDEGVTLLEKPFTREQLLRAVRAAISSGVG